MDLYPLNLIRLSHYCDQVMMNDMGSDPAMMTIWMSGNHLLKFFWHDDDSDDGDDDNMEPAGVLDSKAEHNERHRSFWNSIVLLQDVF